MKDKVNNPERCPSLSAVFAVPDDPAPRTADPSSPGATPAASITSPALPPLVTFNQSPPPAALLPFPPPVLVGPPRPADDCDEAALCAYLLAMLAFVKGYCLHHLRTWDTERAGLRRGMTEPMNRDPAAYQLDYYITKIIEAVPVGTPDYLLCFRGRFIGIEMKNPTTYRRANHNLSARQLRAHDHINAAGGSTVTLGTASQVEDFVLSLYWPL